MIQAQMRRIVAEPLGQLRCQPPPRSIECPSLPSIYQVRYHSTLRYDESPQPRRLDPLLRLSRHSARRKFWETAPFDETLPTAEDSAWTIGQLRNGHVCRRLSLPFGYRRGGVSRDADFARVTFTCARRYGLKVVWLGPVASVKLLAKARFRQLFLPQAPDSPGDTQAVRDRLTAWWRSQRRQNLK